MKYILYLASLISSTLCAQTITQSTPKNVGSVSIKKISIDSALVAYIYLLNDDTSASIILKPTDIQISRMTLVMTATSSVSTGDIAGRAYMNGKLYGTKDKHFTPNSWLISENGAVRISSDPCIKPRCTAVQVFTLIQDGKLLDSLIKKRDRSIGEWRFLVQNNWHHDQNGVPVKKGTDIFIIDFVSTISLTQACKWIKHMEKHMTTTDGFQYNDSFTVCQLEANGVLKSILFRGIYGPGPFMKNQSNVLIIK